MGGRYALPSWSQCCRGLVIAGDQLSMFELDASTQDFAAACVNSGTLA